MTRRSSFGRTPRLSLVPSLDDFSLSLGNMFISLRSLGVDGYVRVHDVTNTHGCVACLGRQTDRRTPSWLHRTFIDSPETDSLSGRMPLWFKRRSSIPPALQWKGLLIAHWSESSECRVSSQDKVQAHCGSGTRKQGAPAAVQASAKGQAANSSEKPQSRRGDEPRDGCGRSPASWNNVTSGPVPATRHATNRAERLLLLTQLLYSALLEGCLHYDRPCSFLQY